MFYSHDILNIRSGRLSIIWMVATGNNAEVMRKYGRELRAVNVPRSCDHIIRHLIGNKANTDTVQHYSLYLSAMLMYGAVKVFSRQVTFLYDEAMEPFIRIQRSIPLFQVGQSKNPNLDAKKVTLHGGDAILELLHNQTTEAVDLRLMEELDFRSSHCWRNGGKKDRKELTPCALTKQQGKSDNIHEMMRDWTEDMLNAPLLYPHSVNNISDITMREELGPNEPLMQPQLDTISGPSVLNEFGPPFTDAPELMQQLPNIRISPPEKMPDDTPVLAKKPVVRRIDFEEPNDKSSDDTVARKVIEEQPEQLEPPLVEEQPPVLEPVQPQDPIPTIELTGAVEITAALPDETKQTERQKTDDARIREELMTPLPPPADDAAPPKRRAKSTAPPEDEAEKTLDTVGRERKSKRRTDAPLELDALPTSPIELVGVKRKQTGAHKKERAKRRKMKRLIIDEVIHISRSVIRDQCADANDTLRVTDSRSNIIDVLPLFARRPADKLLLGVYHHGFYHCDRQVTPFLRLHEVVHNRPPMGAQCLTNLLTRHHLPSHRIERYDYEKTAKRSIQSEYPDDDPSVAELREAASDMSSILASKSLSSLHQSKSSSLIGSGLRMKSLRKRVREAVADISNIAPLDLRNENQLQSEWPVINQPEAMGIAAIEIAPPVEPPQPMDVATPQVVEPPLLENLPPLEGVPLTREEQEAADLRTALLLQEQLDLEEGMNQSRLEAEKTGRDFPEEEAAVTPGGTVLPRGHVLIVSEGSPRIVRKTTDEIQREGLTSLSVQPDLHHPPPENRQMNSPPVQPDENGPPPKRSKLDMPQTEANRLDETLQVAPTEARHIPAPDQSLLDAEQSFLVPPGVPADPQFLDFVPSSVTPIKALSPPIVSTKTIPHSAEETTSLIMGKLKRDWRDQICPVTFTSLVGEGASRNEVTAIFYRLLELHKLRMLVLHQTENYGTIEIKAVNH